MNTALTTRIAQEHDRTLTAAPRADLATQRRRGAMERLTARGLPGARDENWKYANLRPLEKAVFEPGLPGAAVRADQLPDLIVPYRRYVFIDGAFAPELSAALDDKDGVAVRSLRGAPLASTTSEDADARFALLNEAFATDGASVSTAASIDCAACVELIFVATGGAASYPRVELRAGPGSRLGVIERHLSVGDQAHLVTCAVQIEAASGARVDHYRVQQSGSQATWIDTLEARLAQGADYQLHLIHLGAVSARSTLQIRLNGEAAVCGLHCAAVAERQQTHDIYALVDHVAARSVSRQTFRGIAAGRARVACNSMVVVRQGAHGADSQQSLRGLLAGTDAEIDVRPQLEIYTDDVRCAHGATAGKLDDAMLFYLLSRGIDPDTAQLLLKWAFLEDVVAKVPVRELRRQIEKVVAGRMSGTAALAELL